MPSGAPANAAAFTPCRSHRLASLVMRSLVPSWHWQPLLMSSTATLFTGPPTATAATGCGFLCSSFHALGGSSIMHGARRRQMGLAARRPRGSTRLVVRCLNRWGIERRICAVLSPGFRRLWLGTDPVIWIFPGERDTEGEDRIPVVVCPCVMRCTCFVSESFSYCISSLWRGGRGGGGGGGRSVLYHMKMLGE